MVRNRQNEEHWYAKVIGHLERWSHLGDRQFDQGGRVIAHMPSIAERAYMHKLYRPLFEDEISEAESFIGQTIPKPFQEFLQLTNGIRLFNNILSLNGFIRKIDRDPYALPGQPISMEYGTVIGPPNDLPDGAFCFGGIVGYDVVGNLVLMPDLSVILINERDGTDIGASWPSFESMLLSEVDRLSSLHNDDGELLIDRWKVLPGKASDWDHAPAPDSV